MRYPIFIFLAMAIVWPLIYFMIPVAGYPLKMWALIAVASVSAIFAGVFVLLGENLIEDVTKTAVILIVSGILWFQTPKFGFLFICALSSTVIGTLINQINRFVDNKAARGDA